MFAPDLSAITELSPVTDVNLRKGFAIISAYVGSKANATGLDLALKPVLDRFEVDDVLNEQEYQASQREFDDDYVRFLSSMGIGQELPVVDTVASPEDSVPDVFIDDTPESSDVLRPTPVFGGHFMLYGSYLARLVSEIDRHGEPDDHLVIEDEPLFEVEPAESAIVYDDGEEEQQVSKWPRLRRIAAGLGLAATALASGVLIKDGYPDLAMQAPHTSAALVDTAARGFGSSEYLYGTVGAAASVAVAGLARWAWKDHVRHHTPEVAEEVSQEVAVHTHRVPRYARMRALGTQVKNIVRMPVDGVEYTDVPVRGLFS